MLFPKKGETRFEFLAGRIYSNLQKGKFSLALAHYNKFESSFKMLKAEKKEKLGDKYDFIKNCLVLYMDSVDLNKYSDTWSLAEIENRLDRIKDIKSDVGKIPLKLNRAVNSNYKESKKIYDYRVAKEKIDILINEIDKLVDEGNFDFALDKFRELEGLGDTLSSCFKGDFGRIQKLLDEMKEHLEFSYMESLAYAKPAEYEKVKKPKEKKPSELKLVSSKPDTQQKFTKLDKYTQLRDLIESGDVDAIEKFRSDLG